MSFPRVGEASFQQPRGNSPPPSLGLALVFLENLIALQFAEFGLVGETGRDHPVQRREEGLPEPGKIVLGRPVRYAPYLSRRPACASARDIRSFPGTTPSSPSRHDDSPNTSAEGRAHFEATSVGTWCQLCSL